MLLEYIPALPEEHAEFLECYGPEQQEIFLVLLKWKPEELHVCPYLRCDQRPPRAFCLACASENRCVFERRANCPSRRCVAGVVFLGLSFVHVSCVHLCNFCLIRCREESLIRTGVKGAFHLPTVRGLWIKMDFQLGRTEVTWWCFHSEGRRQTQRMWYMLRWKITYGAKDASGPLDIFFLYF